MLTNNDIMADIIFINFKTLMKNHCEPLAAVDQSPLHSTLCSIYQNINNCMCEVKNSNYSSRLANNIVLVSCMGEENTKRSKVWFVYAVCYGNIASMSGFAAVDESVF